MKIPYPHEFNRWDEYWGVDILEGWLRVQLGPVSIREKGQISSLVPFDDCWNNGYEVHLLHKRKGNYYYVTSRREPKEMEETLINYINYLKYVVETGDNPLKIEVE